MIYVAYISSIIQHSTLNSNFMIQIMCSIQLDKNYLIIQVFYNTQVGPTNLLTRTTLLHIGTQCVNHLTDNLLILQPETEHKQWHKYNKMCHSDNRATLPTTAKVTDASSTNTDKI